MINGNDGRTAHPTLRSLDAPLEGDRRPGQSISSHQWPTIARFFAAIPLLAVLAIVALAAVDTRTATALDSEEQTFLSMINNYRAAEGLGTLALDPQLNEVALWMVNDMASNDYFSHTDSLGRDPFARMDQIGYAYNTWRGENLVAGGRDRPGTTPTCLVSTTRSSASRALSMRHRASAGTGRRSSVVTPRHRRQHRSRRHLRRHPRRRRPQPRRSPQPHRPSRTRFRIRSRRRHPRHRRTPRRRRPHQQRRRKASPPARRS